MILSKRERELVTSALYILEGQCIADAVDNDAVDDLGGVPDPEEVRALMGKIGADSQPTAEPSLLAAAIAVEGLEKKEARMRKDYPAGTCNAEDAWGQFAAEKRATWDNFRTAIKKES